MADSAVTARLTTRQMLIKNLKKYELPTNESGLYNVENAVNWLLKVERELKEVYLPGGSSNSDGALQLCTNGTNLAKIKSTDMATAANVLEHYRKKATDERARTGITVEPEITTRAEAHEEAERINTRYQTVIGIKEAIAHATRETFGATVTDSVLRTADGTDYKSINDWTVENLFEAIRQGADRPTTAEIHAQLNKLTNFSFNFQQKVQTGYDSLLATAGRLKAVGIIIPPSIRGHILLHQIEQAQKEDWGRDFRPCVQTLRKSYPYTYVHDDASIANMLAELAGADAVRNLAEAPTSLPERANAVSAVMSSILRNSEAFETDDDEDTTEYASAVASESDSSVETRRPRRKSHDKRGRSSSTKHRRGASRGRGRDTDEREEVKCKHCKKADRVATHVGIAEADCYFNPKHKAWKPEWVCDRLEIDYVPKRKFKDSK
jgi:hypothetical protein